MFDFVRKKIYKDSEAEKNAFFQKKIIKTNFSLIYFSIQ